jgi:hypothetical protein
MMLFWFCVEITWTCTRFIVRVRRSFSIHSISCCNEEDTQQIIPISLVILFEQYRTQNRRLLAVAK